MIENFFALDLEFTQPSARTIQVGVAIGNPTHGVVSTHSWYLDPKEQISQFITDLTGITDETIQERAQPHSEVAAELGALLGRTPNLFVNPITWGAGDSGSLLTEFRDRGIEFPHFGRRWLDVKTLYVFKALANGRNPSGGLKSAMGRYKLPFKGTPHRAEMDAQNTLEFFFKLLSQEATTQAAIDSLKAIV